MLPFHVAVFNAVIATFNSYEDAKNYARFKSVQYPDGWVEIRDPDQRGAIIVAYRNNDVVHGEE